MTAENDIFAFFDRKLNFTKKDEQLQAYLAIDSEKALHIDTKHQSAYNAFPIHYACLYNSKKYFANPKLPHSQIDIPGGTYGSTPMMFTIYNSSYKLLLSLLLNGADISKRNTRSSDVLSFCVRFDDVLGLILVLSFMDKEVNVKRYLKYARIKKAVETRDFLINRRLELEGKNDDINNGFLSMYFTRDNIISLFSWLCFIGMLIYFKYFRFVFSVVYFLLYSFFSFTYLPLIFNIFYIIYAYYTVLNSVFAGVCVYVVISIHLLSFVLMFLMKNSCSKINKMKEVKPLITDLVLQDDYCTAYFCVPCLNQKSLTREHCDICNRCVKNRIYHCLALNKCITTKNKIGFFIFAGFSTVVFALASEINYEEFWFNEFYICTFLSVASIESYYREWKRYELKDWRYNYDDYIVD